MQPIAFSQQVLAAGRSNRTTSASLVSEADRLGLAFPLDIAHVDAVGALLLQVQANTHLALIRWGMCTYEGSPEGKKEPWVAYFALNEFRRSKQGPRAYGVAMPVREVLISTRRNGFGGPIQVLLEEVDMVEQSGIVRAEGDGYDPGDWRF